MAYLKLILLFSLLAVLGGGYAYHQVTVSNLETQVVQLEANNRTLKENQVQMEIAVKTAQDSLAAAEANAKKSEAAMTALTQRNNELQKDKDNAMRIFRDHNLTRLARAKPGMIEKRMNAKTEAVFRELENDTKELMDSDDTDSPAGVLDNAQAGVGVETQGNSTGDEGNNGNGEGPTEDLPTAPATGD